MSWCIYQEGLNKMTLRITCAKHLQILNAMRLYVDLKNWIWIKKVEVIITCLEAPKPLTSRSEINWCQRQYFTRMANKEAVGKTRRFKILITVTSHLLWSMEGITSKSIISEINILVGIWSLFAIFSQN